MHLGGILARVRVENAGKRSVRRFGALDRVQLFGFGVGVAVSEPALDERVDAGAAGRAIVANDRINPLMLSCGEFLGVLRERGRAHGRRK